MDVTDSPITCTLPSDGQPGCGCKPKPGRTARTAAKAAVIAAGTAAACAACCVLPFALPAVIVANIGGMLAMLDHAYGWVTWAAVAAVAGAWVWIWRQIRATGMRPALSTIAMMVVATAVISFAVSWPLLKPVVFQTLGIARKTSG